MIEFKSALLSVLALFWLLTLTVPVARCQDSPEEPDSEDVVYLKRTRRKLDPVGMRFDIAFIIDGPNKNELRDKAQKYVNDISYCRSVNHPCASEEDALSQDIIVPQMKFNPIMIDPGQSVTETILTICNQIKLKALVGVVISSANQYVHLSLASVAYHFGIPIVDFSSANYQGYYTTDSYIYVNTAQQVDDDVRAIASLCDALGMRKIAVVSPDNRDGNDFKHNFARQLFAKSQLYFYNGMPDKDMSMHNITWIEHDQDGATCREMEVSKLTVFVIHGNKNDAALLFQNCQSLFNRIRPALIVTENIITTENQFLDVYPDGLIAVRRKPDSTVGQALNSSIDVLINATKDLINIKYESAQFARVNFQRDLQLSERTQPIPEFRRVTFTNRFRTCLMNILTANPYCVKPISGVYEVLNLYNVDGIRSWNLKGQISQHGKADLDQIVWSGNTYAAPSFDNSARRSIKIAIAAIEPFLILNEPGADRRCYNGKDCYPVVGPNEDPLQRIEVIRIPKGIDPVSNKTYFDAIRHCCIGLEVDLVERISYDVGFDYELYFGNFPAGATMKESQKWVGLVGAVLDQEVDFAIGSISTTKSRSQAVRFTIPYFYSGYAIMVAKQPPRPEMFAFIKPLDVRVWFFIFICMNGLAIIKACCEWLSPYGLNPKTQVNGPGRGRIFAFPSALTTVYSLLFLHAHPYKLPRSLSARILTYLWAGIAVLVVAAYTANLASFMAGRLTYLDLDVLKIQKLMHTLKYGAEKGSSAQKYISEQWPLMSRVMEQNLVSGSVEAIERLKNGTLDAYFDDGPIVFWKVISDPDCKLLTVGSTFGDGYYGVAVSKDNLQNIFFEQINQLLHKYRENFFLDRLREKWFIESKVKTCLSDDIQHNSLGLDHVAGLFMILGITIVICLVILGLEHFCYRFILPRLPHQRNPDNKTLLFVSQKLHRLVLQNGLKRLEKQGSEETPNPKPILKDSSQSKTAKAEDHGHYTEPLLGNHQETPHRNFAQNNNLTSGSRMRMGRSQSLPRNPSHVVSSLAATDQTGLKTNLMFANGNRGDLSGVQSPVSPQSPKSPSVSNTRDLSSSSSQSGRDKITTGQTAFTPKPSAHLLPMPDDSPICRLRNQNSTNEGRGVFADQPYTTRL